MTAEEQDGPFTVENNDIADTGAEYKGCAGVFGGYVVETAITNNEITNCSNGVPQPKKQKHYSNRIFLSSLYEPSAPLKRVKT
jgi:hypothetical protein